MPFQHRFLNAIALPVLNACRPRVVHDAGWDSDEEVGSADDIVCSCLQITRGTIDAAVAEGCQTFEAISARTGCGRVCGGCEPLVRGVGGWAPIDILDEQRLAPDVLRLRFRPRSGVPPHTAGQHVLLRGRVGRAWVQRAYTLASAAGTDDHQEVLVQRRPDGAFSRWLFETPPSERQLQVSAPRGNFVWTPSERPTVCWVAGIGVTPALAIVRTADRTRHAAPLHIDLSVRHASRAAGLDVLERVAARRDALTLNFRLTAASGHLTAEEIGQQVTRFPRAHHVVCGPLAYTEDVCRALAAHGVADDDILIERFHVAAQPGPDEAAVRGRPSLRPGGAPAAERVERAAEIVRTLEREGAQLEAPGGDAPLQLRADGDTPGVHDGVGYVAATYAEVQNIPALEAACNNLVLPQASPAATWRAVLQSVELALDVAARLGDDIADRLEAGDIESSADRMDWLAGMHALVVALAEAGWRATGPLVRTSGPTLSVRSSPARGRLMTATQRIDRALRRAFEQPDQTHGDRMGALLARGRLCEAAPRLDRAACISMERWRVWERSLSAVPVGVAGLDYGALVDADGIACVVERPRYGASTLINPFRGLHLVQERLAREAIDQLDRASALLEQPSRTPEEWETAWCSIRAAAQLMGPMCVALQSMTEGLAVAEYRRFRKNFGRTSASESAALASALFHRAPERLGEAAAGALGLLSQADEGEPLSAALERLPASERVFARTLLDAIDELHRAVAAWLDVHMLLPVLHLGQARSLAGRIDAVTSNRLKRRETLSRGWFGRLGAPANDDVAPSAELDAEAGYLAWRAARLGDVQLADAAHLAEDQPTGQVLDRLASELRRLERGAA